jgi:hypothetical protein
MNFKEEIKKFLLKFRTKSREVMLVSKDFMSGYYDIFIVLWFFKVVGEICQIICIGKRVPMML